MTRLVSMAVLLAVASCASVPPVATPAAPAATGAATVLTVRPIAATGDTGAWRAALLDGAADSGAASTPAVGLAEFIVRGDDGATLSIVQSNAAGLRVGDRVTLARPSAATGSPRLVRLL